MSAKIQDLPIEKRIKLVEDLWDSIAADQARVPLTSAQKRELNIRLDEFEVDGDVGVPGTEVIHRIRPSL